MWQELLKFVAMTIASAGCGLMLSTPVRAGSVSTVPPATPDPAARYLFYMHGLAVETGEYNRTAGSYDYDKILDAFAQRGFTVIGEHRPAGTHPIRYARKVTDEIEQLLSAGVPARNITVAGHSKGGFITMVVASQLQSRQIHFVVLAGCILRFHQFDEFVERRAPRMHGRILSVYDKIDDMAGSCRAALDRARDAVVDERVVNTGRGHWLFYKANPVWLDIVQGWAESN